MPNCSSHRRRSSRRSSTASWRRRATSGSSRITWTPARRADRRVAAERASARCCRRATTISARHRAPRRAQGAMCVVPLSAGARCDRRRAPAAAPVAASRRRWTRLAPPARARRHARDRSSAARSCIRPRGSSTALLAAELAADHMKCFAINALLGTQRLASRASRDSLASALRLERAHLPQAAAEERLELVGSRPCLYGEGQDRAHHVPAQRRAGVAVHAAARRRAPSSSSTCSDTKRPIWSVGDRTFVLVSRARRAPRSSAWRRSSTPRCDQSSTIEESDEHAHPVGDRRRRRRCACGADADHADAVADARSTRRWWSSDGDRRLERQPSRC